MLCETGQRRHSREPGSMVIELLRTVFTYVFRKFDIPNFISRISKESNFFSIFHFSSNICSLPEPLESAEKVEHRMYDEAHASTGECQQQYPKCKESVWNSKYM